MNVWSSSNPATFLGNIIPFLGNQFQKEQIADDHLQFIHGRKIVEYRAP